MNVVESPRPITEMSTKSMSEVVVRHDGREVGHPPLKSTIDERSRSRDIVRPISSDYAHLVSQISRDRERGRTCIFLLPVCSVEDDVEIDQIELSKRLVNTLHAYRIEVIREVVHPRREDDHTARGEGRRDRDLRVGSIRVLVGCSDDGREGYEGRVETAQSRGGVARSRRVDLGGGSRDELNVRRVEADRSDCHHHLVSAIIIEEGEERTYSDS